MASSPINVANPIATPRAVDLAQIAANISSTIASGNRNGNYQDVYDQLIDLAAAVNCCAQALLTINNTTASSVGTVQTRVSYALGAAAVIPASINTAAV